MRAYLKPGANQSFRHAATEAAFPRFSAPHAFRGLLVPFRAGLHRTLTTGFYTVCREISRESPSSLVSCRSAKVLLAPSLSTLLPRERSPRARRMFTRMVQRKPRPESPCGASTKCFCQFERRCHQKHLSKPQQRTTATSTDAFSRFSFRILVSKRLPLTDIFARFPFRVLNEEHPRPA